MPAIELRILSAEDIQSVIGLDEINTITEDAYRRTGSGNIECPTKVSLPLPGNDERHMHWINSMPALLKDEGIVGLKWVNVTSANRQRGLPVTMGTIILNDAETAVPLAIMDGTWITHMRTGASVAVGAKYFARRNSEVVTIIGAGSEGRSSLQALSRVFQIRRVNIVDLNRESCEAFVADQSAKVAAEFVIFDKAEPAVRDADIVILTTTARTPILMFDSAKPGDFICTISCMTDLHSQYITDSDKFIVDDIHCAPHRISAMAGLTVTPEMIHADICQILAGLRPGRENDDEIITYAPAGMGGVDLAVAYTAYRKALDKQLGMTTPLIGDTAHL
jgi:ornithine cyclodeaminase/alanine dehydrogenase-like protein (mu-crystallin family)